MQLTTNIDIDGGGVVAGIQCADISDETKEALHDYTRLLRYGDIDFSAKIKVTNGMPEFVEDDDPDGEEIKTGLIDKLFVVDKNLNFKLKPDSNKMSDKELTLSISNVEILTRQNPLSGLTKLRTKFRGLWKLPGNRMQLISKVLLKRLFKKGECKLYDMPF